MSLCVKKTRTGYRPRSHHNGETGKYGRGLTLDARKTAPTERGARRPGGRPCAFPASNTGMAVVPDSNRISFSSTQRTTFQTVFHIFSCGNYSIFFPPAQALRGNFLKKPEVNRAGWQKGREARISVRPAAFRFRRIRELSARRGLPSRPSRRDHRPSRPGRPSCPPGSRPPRPR